MTEIEEEQWRPALDRILVSNLGRVKFLPFVAKNGKKWKEKITSGAQTAGGYRRVSVGGKGFKVHSLVLLAFVGPRPDGMECCHGDGDGSNNRLSNLRYDTPESNNRDREKHGKTKRGEVHPMAKLTNEQVLEIYAAPHEPSDLAKRYGVSPASICDIKFGRSWGWLTNAN